MARQKTINAMGGTIRGDAKDVNAIQASFPSAIMRHHERAVKVGIECAMDLASATAAKWYLDPKTGKKIKRNFGEVVALMHSELSEALDAHRKNLMDDKLPHRTGVEVELADCLIRILDTAAHLKLDLAGAVIEKNRYNMSRADHKPAARAAKGGKRY